MAEEVIPGLYRLSLPLPNDSPGQVNAYVVKGADGLRLIDCGLNTAEAYAALVAELQQFGGQISDIAEILVTHNHPDHIGLTERLVQEAGASLLLHRLDVPPAPLSSEERRERLVGMENWLQTNGMPPEEGEVLLRDMSRMPSRVPAYRPDVLLEGGEVLEWSPFHFEVLWTPGHAAGLVCLYERQFQVLLSSDHILERISPNIGLYAQQSGDPLGEYLRSLQLVRDLPVKLVLPGHGSPFSDLSGRVDKLEAHHEQRLREMVNTLGDGEQTAYRIASRLSWRGSNQGWQQLRSFDRLAALSETLAHLHYLARQGQVTQQERDGEIVYR